MNKICTTIEQSKRLIELGIDINTADMFWLTTDKPRLHVLVEDLENYSRWDCMPAWSLTALSNFILPYIMDNDGNNYRINISMDGLNRWIAYYKSDNLSIHICEESKDLIDVIFEMVCWLNENLK